MKPRVIELHIEELILHGFDPATRWEVGDALQSELRGLLATHGIPLAWQANPERIETGAVSATAQSRPAVWGTEIARVIHPGGER